MCVCMWVGGSCVWFDAQIPEWGRDLLYITKQERCCQFRYRVEESRRGQDGGFTARQPCQSPSQQMVCVSGGWWGRVCCGFELRINVRREVSACSSQGWGVGGKVKRLGKSGMEMMLTSFPGRPPADLINAVLGEGNKFPFRHPTGCLGATST